MDPSAGLRSVVRRAKFASLAVSLSLAAVSVLTACGSDDASGGSGGASTGGAAGASTGGGGVGGFAGAATGGSGGTSADGGGCERVFGAPDALRKVVVSHPYDASQKQSDGYEVLSLDASGVLAKTGTTFQLGRAVDGEVVFTPDGELGFVATDKGTVGVFRLEPDGSVTVLHAGLAGSFYASKLVMAPKGDRLYVIDSEWRDIGGGIYSLGIGCDDSIVEEGLVAAAKLPAGLVFLGPAAGQAVVPASDILDSPADQHVHLLDWGASPTVVSSVTAFSADSPIVSSFAVTSDEQLALVGDGSGFSSVPNRVAVVSVGAGALTALQEVSPIEDPADIETSPHDKTALVASGFGDALFVLSHDASKPSAPYSAKELSYAGAKPQIPVTMVQLRRGALTGHVLVAEVSAVRQVVFDAAQGVVDHGPFDMGGGVENIVGAIGVQP